MAFDVGETSDRAVVRARDLATGTLHQFEADPSMVASGAIGTTRLVLASLGNNEREVMLGESQQFILPMVSLRAIPGRVEQGFTLNQFNMTVDMGKDDFAQMHFYTHDPSFAERAPESIALPRRDTRAGAAAAAAERRARISPLVALAAVAHGGSSGEHAATAQDLWRLA